MTKPELGTKRDCPSCGAKFYDLNKSPATCPKCKTEFVPEQAVKPKRAKPAEKPKEKAPVRKARVEEDEDGDVSLDALRDEELADDADDDLLAGIDDADDDTDDADDAFLPDDDDDDDDDVSSIVRTGGSDDE